MEEKYKLLHGKTSSLFDMEEEVLKVSEKVRLVFRETGSDLMDGTLLNGQFTQITGKKKTLSVNP